MEITGKIKVIKEVQTFGANNFKKRELVITTNDQYPQPILIEFVQDNCDLLNTFALNDEVTVSINLRGREWQSPKGELKYFSTFQGWKINKLNKTTDTITPSDTTSTHNISNKKMEADDDFPF